jgi:2-isopropylmalate synthase
VLQTDHGLDLPKRLQADFSGVIQRIADTTGKEISPAAIWQEFQATYLAAGKFGFVRHVTLPQKPPHEARRIEATVTVDGGERTISGEGNGPIAALVDALSTAHGLDIAIADFREHAVGGGADARAAAYVEARVNGTTCFGVGIDTNTVAAALKAVLSAVNRAF